MSVLRVLSYNVHKGFCSANRQFLLEKIRQSIRVVDADVVFLQEVVGENTQHASQIDGRISLTVKMRYTTMVITAMPF